MASMLPTIPYAVFCVLEPISLVAGFVHAWFSTTTFVQEQLPQSRVQSMLPVSPNAKVLAMQLGNLYGLMCLLGVMLLNTTSERKVVRGYLICLAIADIGHITPTLYYMGWNHATDIASWNVMAHGNVFATLFLFVTRILTLTGVFGEKTAAAAAKGKKA